MPSPAVEPLSSMIRDFAERHPGVAVSIRDAAVPQAVLDSVRTGVTELGLLSAREFPTTSEVDLRPVGESDSCW